MLKLSYSTLPCDDWDIDRMIEICMKYGFSGIELRESEESWVSLSLPQNERKRIKKIFKQNNIAITNIGSSVCFLGNRLENIDEKLQKLDMNIRLASDLGAKGVRIFLGNFIERYNDPKEEIDEQILVDILKTACEMAFEKNAEIWVETHNEFGSGKSLHDLLASVNRDNCGVLWDVMHPLEESEAPAETLHNLNSLCRHVHIKDGKPFEDSSFHRWQYTKLGEGEIPNKQIINLLQNKSFQGYFSLEWENKWRPELQFPKIDPEIILKHYSEYMGEIEKELNRICNDGERE